MASNTTETRGVRLPNELWADLAEDAKELKKSVNELISLRLRARTQRASDNRKTVEDDQNVDGAFES